jgi:tocopherol cyclase
MKLYNPEVFQGNLKKTRYFEGWYFKHVSENREQVYSFIPGISLTPNDKHAFIQFIDGITGQTEYVRFPLEAFSFIPDKQELRVGDNWFSEEGISLDIKTKTFRAYGDVDYSGLVKYPKTLFSPGIMGWYSFVPFMECKHGIGSMLHQLEGSLRVYHQETRFSGGKGYIEKDWGTSFPESWIWLHCNNFGEPDCSFTFSVAKIPWLGSFFIGHICFLYLKGKFYLFATYNHSKITSLTFVDQLLNIELKRKGLILKVQAYQKKAGHLKAPVTGEMNRIIKESIDSEIEIALSEKNGKQLFNSKGTRAGLEIIEKILTYF